MKKVFYLTLSLFVFLLVSCGCNQQSNSDKDTSEVDSTDVFADDSWSSDIKIKGAMYRTCETEAYISLNRESANSYFGEMRLVCGDSEFDKPEIISDITGLASFKIKGKLNGNTMIIVIDSYEVEQDHGNIFELKQLHNFRTGQQVFSITINEKSSASAQALGNMRKFFDDGDIIVEVQGMSTKCTQEEDPADNTEAFIKAELAKYIKNYRKNPNVVLSSRAKEDLMDSSWPEISCNIEGALDNVGSDVVVNKVGENAYRYQCKCTCGKETYVDNWIINAILQDGKVKILSFGFKE